MQISRVDVARWTLNCFVTGPSRAITQKRCLTLLGAFKKLIDGVSEKSRDYNSLLKILKKSFHYGLISNGYHRILPLFKRREPQLLWNVKLKELLVIFEGSFWSAPCKLKIAWNLYWLIMEVGTKGQILGWHQQHTEHASSLKVGWEVHYVR